jgi:hypothetical protein
MHVLHLLAYPVGGGCRIHTAHYWLQLSVCVCVCVCVCLSISLHILRHQAYCSLTPCDSETSFTQTIPFRQRILTLTPHPSLTPLTHCMEFHLSRHSSSKVINVRVSKLICLFDNYFPHGVARRFT